MIEQNDKRRERFYDRQEKCNKTFREVFGPVALTYIEALVNSNQFQQAWLTIHNQYNTVPGSMLRSGILRKLNLIQYDMEVHTIGSVIQLLEETWEPLVANGGYSDDEKIDMLRNAFRNHDDLFRDTFDYCRRNESTYAQTRDLIIRETTLKMTEMAKEHNMIEHIKRNYMGKSKPEKIYSLEKDEESGEMARVRANVTCYNCGKTGHYSSECRTERKVVKKYTPTEGNTNRSYSVETKTKEMETRTEDLPEVDMNLPEVMVQGCREAQEIVEDLQILEDLKDPETQVLLLKDQLEESIALIQDSHRQQQVDVAAEVQILKEDLIE